MQPEGVGCTQGGGGGLRSVPGDIPNLKEPEQRATLDSKLYPSQKVHTNNHVIMIPCTTTLVIQRSHEAQTAPLPSPEILLEHSNVKSPSLWVCWVLHTSVKVMLPVGTNKLQEV